MPFDGKQFQVEISPVARVLREAREKIEKPSNWCMIYFTHPDSGAHCIEGALNAVGCIFDNAVRDALIASIPAGHPALRHPRNIIPMMFNDYPSTTHADVLALFDRAIAARREELGR